jgi:hypothetical protein
VELAEAVGRTILGHKKGDPGLPAPPALSLLRSRGPPLGTGDQRNGMPPARRRQTDEGFRFIRVTPESRSREPGMESALLSFGDGPVLEIGEQRSRFASRISDATLASTLT